MKKLMALVLAAACVLPMSVPVLAKTADYTWGSVSAGDMFDEDGVRLDTGDVVRPGKTVYYKFGDYKFYDYLTDTDMVKIDVDKDTGSKYISSAKIVNKTLGGQRNTALEIVTKDNFTADELKAKIDVYVTAKKDLKATNPGSGQFPIYVSGTTGSAGSAADIAAQQAVITALTNDINTLKNTTIPGIQTHVTSLTKWETETMAVANVGNVLLKDIAGNSTTADGAATDTTNALDTANARITTIGESGGTGALKTAEDAVVTAEGAVRTKIGANAYEADASDTYTVTVPTPFNTNVGSWTVAYSTGGVDAGYTTAGANATLLAAITGAISTEMSTYDTAVGTVTALKNELATLKASISGLTTAKDNAALAKAGYDAAKVVTAYTTAQTAANAAIAAGYANLTAANTALNTQKTNLSNKEKQLPLEQAKLRALQGTPSLGEDYLPKGKTMKVPMTFWIENEKLEDSDFTFTAGDKGVVIKPEKNEEITVTFEDGNGTLAITKFTADSSSEYFMPRLSTKWATNEDYDQFFRDGEAYVRSFVGEPNLPCTSRASLWVNNPFNDEDGESTIDMDDVYVYQVIDGEPREITYEATQNEDDEDAFLIRTRQLGTYIFSDTPADIEDDDDYLPEDPPKVDIGNTSKPNPGTGF